MRYPRSGDAKRSSGTLLPEASGFLVDPAVFNTDEGATSSLAGSIPVRLRDRRGPHAHRFTRRDAG